MDKLYTQFKSFAGKSCFSSPLSIPDPLSSHSEGRIASIEKAISFGVRLLFAALILTNTIQINAQCNGVGSSLATGATVSSCGGSSNISIAPTGWGTIGNLTSGYTYSITSTNGSYITIFQNSGTGTVITSGTSPISFTSAYTGLAAASVYSSACSNTWNGSSASLTYTLTSVPVAAPTVNASTSVTCGEMTVNWSASANANNYLLDISTNNGFSSFINTNQNYQNFNTGNTTSYPVTGLASNTTYYIRVRAQNTTCSITSGYSGTGSTLTFTTPAVSAGSTITTCTGTSAITLSGATASGNYSGTPTWSGSGGTFTQNPNPALATFTPSTPSGSITATLSLTGANSCSSPTSSRTITWGTQPAATAGGNITTCTGLSAITMSSATASGTYSAVTWSGGAGLGVWTQNVNPALATFTPTTASGSFSALLTLTGANGCVDATASRTITWGTAPAAVAGLDITSCTGTNAITLSGASASGTYSNPPTWSGAGPGTFTQNNNPALATFTPSAASGSFTATLTLTGLNGCSNSTATRNITWGTAPVASAGSNINSCTGTSAITLSGATASGSYTGTPAWSGGAGLGTFTQNADPALATFTPSVASGSFTATLTLTGTNGCSNATSTRVISWGVQPTASAGTDITTCTGTTAINMTGATASGTYVNPTWTGGVGLGAWSQDADPAVAYFVPTTAQGSFTATLTLTGANGCTNATSTRVITWGTQPVAFAGSNITSCTGTNAITLTGATATGTYTGTPQWTGGTGLGSFTQNANPALATFTPTTGSGSFIATLTLTGTNGCSNATSTTVITWGTAPTAVAGPAINSCTGTSVITLSGASASGAYTGTPTWTGAGGLGTFTQDADPALATFTPAVSSGSFTATLNLTGTNGCGNTTDTRVISWGVQPTVDAGTDYLACSGTAPILQTGATVAGTYSSVTWSGGIALGFWTQNADPALATFTPSVATGSFTATLTLAGSNGCATVNDTKTIGWQTSVANNIITAPSATVLCGSSDPANISGTVSPILTGGNGTYNFQWQEKINSGGVWTDIPFANSGDYDPGILPSDTHRFRRVVDSGVCNDTSNVVTIIIEAPITNNLVTFSGVAAFCTTGNPDPISGSVPVTPVGPFTYQWQVSTDNGQTWNNISFATLIDYNPPSITTTTQYRRAVISSSCTDYSNVITITINPTPVITAVTPVQVSCFGGSDASITINANGGTSPLRYSVDSAVSYYPDNVNVITGLSIGTYHIYVTDANSCSIAYPTAITITQPTLLVLTASGTDASCSGVFDGTITASSTGGSGNNSYSLNGGPGQASGNFTGLAAGSYVVYVTNGNLCVDTELVVINNTYAVTGTLLDSSNVSCFGGNDGTATVDLTGGVLPYSYSINGFIFQSTGIFTGLTANNYTATLRDSKGCTAYVPVNITQPALLQARLDSVQNNLCNGSANGGIYITALGGTAPYNYLWSNNSLTEDITNLSAGVYNVTITDANNCSASTGASITQPLQLFVSIASFTNVLCNGDSTGKIDISANGGVPPYTFSWSNGATGEDLLNIPVGTYSVTVTDANNCSAITSQAIGEPAVLTSTLSPTSSLCNGNASGALDLSVSGGLTPYHYLWSNGATTEDLSGVNAGTYSVVVTDKNGCITTNIGNIAQPLNLAVTGIVTNVSCFGSNDGQVDITITGGSAPYTTSWNNGPTSEDINTLPAGTYTVVVTDDNGCTTSASYTVTEPAALSATATVTNVTCNGNSNGAINLTVSGGTTNYTYLWSTGAGAEDLSGLIAATYDVTITDANSCTFTTSFTVTEPGALTSSITSTNNTCALANAGAADLTVTGGTLPYTFFWSNFTTTEDPAGLSGGKYIVIITDNNGCTKRDSVIITEPTQLTLSTTSTNVSCNGGATGSITLTPAGGTPPYSYSWNTGPTTKDLSNLTAGTYTVTVQDANLCTAVTTTVIITQPTAILLNATTLNVACNGGGNGQIDITVGGGVFPYSFAWNNSATTEDLFNLSGGTYDVTITDANGCTITASYTITEPNAITSSTTHTDVNCAGAFNGTVDLTVGGGTVPYTFFWSNFANTEDLAGLGGGKYIVIITDANGCTKRDSVAVTEPNALVLSTVVTNVNCNGGNGAVDLTVAGGTSPYTYSWSNSTSNEDLTAVAAGTYTVTVKDANNCTATASVTVTQPTAILLNATTLNVACNGGGNGQIDITVGGGVFPYSFAWNNSATTEDLFNLSGGTYDVTITDANGCTITASYTITEPNAITSSTTHTDVNCAGAFNGTVDLTVGGGTVPYTFFWSNFANTEDLAGLGGGKYIVIITDANGCTKRDSVAVTEPNALVLSTVVTNVNCNGGNGAVDLTVAGGTSPYTYSWSNSTSNEDLTAVAAGTYTVTVKDANNCTATASITVTQPTAIIVTSNALDVTCAGASNGSIDLTIYGGTAPYTFVWGNSATTEDLFNLSGGTYDVTITDADGCTSTQTFVISEPLAITSSITPVHATCNGAATGSADLTVSGGTSPYIYSWSNFTAAQDINNVQAGTYYVIITDTKSCTKRDSVTITEPAAITLSAVVTNVNCNSGSNGAIDLTVTGGTGAYTYSWSNSTSNQDLTGLAAGTYTVIVTDANSCTATASYTVTQPITLVLTGSAYNALCANTATGSVDITVGGGTLPYTFAWSNSAVTEDIINVAAATYTVTVTDANGCTITAPFVVGQPTVLTSSIIPTNVTCNGADNGSADLTVSGGTSPYTYLWSNFVGSQDVSGLDGGLYIVIITDAKGCTKRDSIQIVEPAPLALSTTVQQISCFNANDGAINLAVTGGTVPFNFAWSNSEFSQNISNLAGGTYSVIVNDANSCTATISALIINPLQLGLNSVVTRPKCHGSNNGAIDIIVSGGSPGYTYNWSNSATTEDISGLLSGTYKLTITDSRGCTKTDSIIVTEPNPLYSTGFITNVSCFGASDGFVDITAYGGTLPYDFKWSTSSITEDIATLPGGNYTVTVTDANLCTSSALYVVNEPPALSVNAVGTNVTCFGSNNGTVKAIATGGLPPYEYLWSTFSVDSSVSNVSAGIYTVLLTDSNGCNTYDSITIHQPAQLLLSGVVTNASCNGNADGAINTTVTGGTGAYTYLWSNNSNSDDLVSLAAGTYTVTVTDVNGCSSSLSFTVTQSGALASNLSISNPVCNGGSTGFASLIVTNGDAPYTYSWSTTPAQTGATATNLAAGTYTVTATDAKGCIILDTAVITEPAKISIATSVTGSKCSSNATGTVSVSVAGGQAPYTFILNNISQPTGNFTGLAPGTYTVIVKDANGCENSGTFSINAPSDISVSLTSDKEFILSGMPVQLSANAASTSAIINYFWSPLDKGNFDYTGCTDTLNCNGPKVSPPVTTTFTVLVMDADSCTATDTITISVLNEESNFMPTAFSPNGDGLNDRFEFDILGATTAEVYIYDRWGQLLYSDAAQPNGITGNKGWDGTYKGTLAAYDTYVYQLRVKYYDGAEKQMTGSFTLMK
jgi:gliding motility-associated-like protein